MRYNTKMENITQGDWQIPGEQGSKKSKFIVVTVVVLAVVAAASFAVWYKKQSEVAEAPAKKEYTKEEKIEILHDFARTSTNISRVEAEATSTQRAGEKGSVLAADGTVKPAAQVVEERIEMLHDIAATIKRSTPLSSEEKLKILNSISR